MAVVPEPSAFLADRVEELEDEVRALRYALARATADLEYLRSGQDD